MKRGNPLTATPSTRWMSMAEYSAYFRVSTPQVRSLIKRGIIFGEKAGPGNSCRWRILTPMWEVELVFHDIDAVLENCYLLPTRAVAELMGGIRPDYIRTITSEGKIKGKVIKIKGDRFGRHYYSLAEVRTLLAKRERRKFHPPRGAKPKEITLGLEWAKKRLKKRPVDPDAPDPKPFFPTRGT